MTAFFDFTVLCVAPSINDHVVIDFVSLLVTFWKIFFPVSRCGEGVAQAEVEKRDAERRW